MVCEYEGICCVVFSQVFYSYFKLHTALFVLCFRVEENVSKLVVLVFFFQDIICFSTFVFLTVWVVISVNRPICHKLYLQKKNYQELSI